MGDSPAKPFVALLLFLAAFITVSIFMLSLSPTRGQAVQETTRTHELMGLQLSKEQVQTGSLEGHISGDFLSTVGYVQGSFDGRPVTYIYLRYRAENGDIIDRLIPRDEVRLRDDLKPGEAATLEIHTVKTRRATYEDIQKDPSLCYKDGPVPPEMCGRKANEIPEEWNVDHEELVVHVPKDA
ncbi:hypothetical protein, partial [Rothia sp. HMSC071B01]|uniref:hypothetical protein n=1 Tax=Rothia sp. HMSC071B01 TaxID=1715007 RepID=UPI000AA03BCE